ncbi:hypothetical protein B0A48_13228 [Cryoendolithus antarcticus]|uniref:Azaphilone pigments biosynthesis cluster protein L N-terminal domain-containing protein n=1 Tax=Cryoendolithus antarcticus TaxID=1507870 RepID=A0A1V8SNJ1_9PEZI|nr:hypothetical protein B0A48_13228 [Cryoendolithus antarcticus]
MSGLEIAAAAIGITDVAVKSIKAVYDFCKAIEEAEGKVVEIKNNIIALMKCADGLDFLKSASDSVKAKILELGLKDSLEQCGKSCKELSGEMKGDMKSLRAKWRVVRHEARIERYLADISTAKSTITLVVSAASLYILVEMGSASEAQRKAQAEQLQRDIESISRDAQQQQERTTLLAAELEKQNQEEYDDDRDSQLRQVNGEVAAHQLLRANCAVASDDLKQLAVVSVKVKDVYAEGAGSSNAAGVSKDAIDKLKEARIEAGKMTAKSGGQNQIGIF